MTAAAPSVFVNDRPRPLARQATVLGLLGELGFAEKRGVAVALNGAVVPRSEWAGRELADADRVVVIRATQGG